jgi:tRNA-dihydrouridine synthase B
VWRADDVGIAGSQRLPECFEVRVCPPGAVSSRLFVNAIDHLTLNSTSIAERSEFRFTVSPMQIGPVRISHPFTQAPLEEHSNACFRKLMKQHGASLVCSERVDAAHVVRSDRRAMRTLSTSPGEAPRAGQISGANPAVMADAAKVVESLGFDVVDLNFECPVRRLLARSEGGALLADPAGLERIVEAVARSVAIPVSIKIRSGPDDQHETAAEVSRRAEAAGAAAVSVHARSVAQGYVGEPNWDVVSRVKLAVRIPVLGGGGIRTAADAVRLLRETGADAVAIGRGCLGNPWIFAQARSLWAGGRNSPEPTARQRVDAMRQLVEDEFRFYGPTVALRRLPRTSGYFAKFLPNCAAFRAGVREVRNLGDFRRLAREFGG